MTPREAKPPAIPIRMPDTEKQLDQLFSAIEEHQWQGHRIGEMVNQGRLNRKQTIELAAKRDQKLYDRRDAIQQAREETREEQIAQEDASEGS